MLRCCRTEGDLYSIPRFDVKRTDIEGFINELRLFHEKFRGCFYRQESREKFFQYMVGQLSDLERKSIEPMALKVEGADIRSMQKFISNTAWDEEKMLRIHHKMVADEMGDEEGVLIFDESGFAKKGDDSAGVSKQYCGNLGKVENCQVGVFAAYASRQGYCLLDKRLFVPEKWFDEDYAVRRKKCEIPEDIVFKKKPQLAVQILTDLQQENIVPFKYIVADTIYGNSPEFINALESCTGKTYFVSIPSDTLCWLQSPKTSTRQYKYKGEIHSKQVAETKPLSVEAVAKRIHDYFWYRGTVSFGNQRTNRI